MSFSKESMKKINKNLNQVHGGTSVRIRCDACGQENPIPRPERTKDDKEGNLLVAHCPKCGKVMRVSPNLFE